MPVKPTDAWRMPRWRYAGLGLVAYLVVLFVHGAVPGLATPTLGQALWTLGFADSFISQSPLAIHAIHFGYPEPAAIAFGLAGALPAAWLLGLGLPPAEAFSAMVAAWLGVALIGAIACARRLGAAPGLAVFAALAWLTLPMLWWHTQYSMLALGMALLPGYHLIVLDLLDTWRAPVWRRMLAALAYLAAAVVAIFMDGYTFMMFACGAGLLLLSHAWQQRRAWRRVLGWWLPVHTAAFAAAYLLFRLYIGRGQFDPEPLAFFRGWGLDLTYLLWPSQGIHWLWDSLGLSLPRSDAQHFGDASVWSTTFLLPWLLLALAGAGYARRRRQPLAGWVAISLLALYMSLGPSLKIDATRPPEMHDRPSQMQAEHALMPTGSAWLSQHLPGFNNMRAAYRWAALGAFGLWALALLGLARRPTFRRGAGHLLLLLLVVSQWPAGERWATVSGYRASIQDIDATLLAALSDDLQPGERVAFLPYRNDFLVNYLAPRLGVRAYNIGGDKNLAAARQHWPPLLAGLPMGSLGDSPVEHLQALLLAEEADAVVLSYYDTFWAAHLWPLRRALQDDLEPLAAALNDLSTLHVTARDDYAVVRLASAAASPPSDPGVR